MRTLGKLLPQCNLKITLQRPYVPQLKSSLQCVLSYEAVQTTNRGAGEFTPKGINKPTIKITIYLFFLPSVLLKRSLCSFMEAKLYNVSLGILG